MDKFWVHYGEAVNRSPADARTLAVQIAATLVRESRVLKIFASALVLFFGLGITVLTGGLLSYVGHVVMAGGAAMFFTALHNKKATWSDIGKALWRGAVIGIVSIVFSFVAASVFSAFAAGPIGQILLTIGCNTISSFLTNGVSNLLREDWSSMTFAKFVNGWKRAEILGMCIGIFSVGASVLLPAETFVNLNEQADAILSSLKDMRELYESCMHHIGPCWQNWIEAFLSSLLGFGMDVLMQLIGDGGVSWKTAFICAIVAFIIHGARAGMSMTRTDPAKDSSIVKVLDPPSEAELIANYNKQGTGNAAEATNDRPLNEDRGEDGPGDDDDDAGDDGGDDGGSEPRRGDDDDAMPDVDTHENPQQESEDDDSNEIGDERPSANDRKSETPGDNNNEERDDEPDSFEIFNSSGGGDNDDRPDGMSYNRTTNVNNSTSGIASGEVENNTLGAANFSSEQLQTIEQEIRYARRLTKKLKEDEKLIADAAKKAGQSTITYNDISNESLVYAYTSGAPLAQSVEDRQYIPPMPLTKEEFDESEAGENTGLLNETNQPEEFRHARIVDIRKGHDSNMLTGLVTEKPKKLETPLIEHIIVYSAEYNEYQMRPSETWPKISNKQSKCIAVAGMKQSGKTTLLHSLIYKYNYVLTENQAIASRIGIGVTMYVLERAGIVILDIADSMDSPEQRSKCLGGLVLELFGYLNCNHILYNIPILNEYTDKDEGYLKTWFEKRSQILNECSQMVRLHGASKVTVVLRPESPGSETTEKVEKTINSFIEDISQLADQISSLKKENVQEGGNSEPIPHTASQDDQESSDSDEQLRTLARTLAAFRLPYLEPDAVSSEPYHNELQLIHTRITSESEQHATANLDEMTDYDDPRTIVDTMAQVWRTLQTSEFLQKTLTAAANKSEAANDDKDAGTEKLSKEIKSFFESVAAMQKQLASFEECKSLFEELKQLERDVNAQVDIEKSLKQEDRDKFLFIRSIISVACMIIKAAREFEIVSNKELGLRVGLRGITCVLGAYGSKCRTIDALAIRFCLQDFDILPHLRDPSIYNNYSDFWCFLWHAAECGFKSWLITFPIANAVDILAKTGELREEPRRMHLFASLFAVSMLNEEVNLSSIVLGEVKSDDDGERIPEYRSDRLLAQMRAGLRVRVKKIIEDIHSGSLDADEGTDQLHELPTEWFNRRVAADFKFTYKYLDSRHKNDCMQTVFEIINKEIAAITAVELVDCKDYWLTFNENTPTEYAIGQLRVLAECVEKANTDDYILIKLCGVLNNLIASRNRGQQDDVNTTLQRILMNLMTAELTRKSRSYPQEEIECLHPNVAHARQRNKVHCLDEVKQRDRRLKQLNRHGLVRLNCMENGLATVAVDRLLAHESRDPVKLKHQSALLQFVDAFVMTAVDDAERRDYVEPMMRERASILRVASSLMSDAAKMLIDVAEVAESFDATPLNVIKAGCTLFSELMHKFHENNLKDFYDAERLVAQKTVNGLTKQDSNSESPMFRCIWNALAEVYQSVVMRRSVLKSVARGELAKLVDMTVVKVVIALLNASRTSGISLATVRAEVRKDEPGSAIVTTLEAINESAKPSILLNHEHLAQQNPRENVIEKSNILRAAYIMHTANGDSFALARINMLNVVEETIQGCRIVIAKAEKATKLSAQMELEERQFEEVETANDDIDQYNRVLRTTENIERPSRPQEMEIVSSETPISLAVDAIFLHVSPIDRLYPKHQVPHQIDFAECEDIFGVGHGCALRMLLTNSSSETLELIKKFKRHLHNIVQKSAPSHLRKDNVKVAKIMQLRGARETLIATGHKETEDERWLIHPSEEQLRVTKSFCDCYEEWTKEDSVPLVTLHSKFEECHQTPLYGREDLISQRLPPDFFNVELEELAAKPISELLALRTRGVGWVKSSRLRCLYSTTQNMLNIN